MAKIYTDKDILAMVSSEMDPTHHEDLKYAQIILDELTITLKHSYNGVGLAAPQIGHFVRMFLFRLNVGVIKHIINPRITSYDEDSLTSIEEGCLSCPGVRINTIERHNKIKISGHSVKGKPFTMHLSGLEAIIFQHELDHLNGILITDYLQEKEDKDIGE